MEHFNFSNKNLLTQLNCQDLATGIETEEIAGEDIIKKPFDPTLIRIDTKTLSIDLIIKRIVHGELILAPGFQRKSGLWKSSTQSRLIESLLIRIPLPAFYMDASNDENWLVVDGLQRLTALKRFIIEQKLQLCGLEFLTYLDGKIFNGLHRSLQRRILETQVVVYCIQKGTPPDVKFNIFKRINTGGLPLTPQEIRHALYQGPVTKFLASLAKCKEFKRATANSIRDDRMADQECILRFFAFLTTSYNNYQSHDFDAFLNSKMDEINSMPESDREALKLVLKRSMNAAFDIFNEDAFRKRYNSEHQRYPINKALFESWSVNLANLSDLELETVKKNKNILISKWLKLMKNRYFDNAISQGTGDVNKVILRFQEIQKIIDEVLLL